MPFVLCVCTGNTCRSPMLAALLRAEAKKRRLQVLVESCGLSADTDQQASEGAIAAMLEYGLDLQSHRSCRCDLDRCRRADLIFALTPRHAEALSSLGLDPLKIHVVAEKSGGIPDPFGGNIEEYAACAAVLAKEIPSLLRLLERASDSA